MSALSNWRELWVFVDKELRSCRRDPIVLFWVALYPLALLVFSCGIGLWTYFAPAKDNHMSISFTGSSSDPRVQFVKHGLEQYSKIKTKDTTDPLASLMRNDLDAVVSVAESGTDVKVQYHDQNDSSYVKDNITSAVESARDKDLRDKLENKGIPRKQLDVFNIDESEIWHSNELAVSMFYTILVAFLFFTTLVVTRSAQCIMSYERDGSALETLLTVPINRLNLVLAKCLTMAIVSMTPPMMCAFCFVFSVLAVALLTVIHFGPPSRAYAQETFTNHDSLVAITAVGVSVLVCFLFSLFCSAGALLITIGSKDRREANNLIAFFSTILGFATLGGLAPGFTTSAMAQFIPVLNMMVLLHQAVTGELSAGTFCQILSEDIVIIGAMLWLACRLLADEGLLFDVQAKGPLVLLTGRARR